MTRVALVEIDFAKPPAASWLGRWLLILGMLAAPVAMLEYRYVLDTVDAQTLEVERLRNRASGERATLTSDNTDDPELRFQIGKANAVLDQLNVPWGDMFTAIEGAQSQDVALLQVQPDARSHVVRMAGAGRDLPAILDYMSRLEQTPSLNDVLLVSHEVKYREPGRPVAFVLSARWVEAQ